MYLINVYWVVCYNLYTLLEFLSINIIRALIGWLLVMSV